jgi:hypothetical protein
MLVHTVEYIEKKRAAIGTTTIILTIAVVFVAVTALGLAQMA